MGTHAYSSISQAMLAEVKAWGVSGDSNSNDSSAGASTVMEVQREIIRELHSHAARKEKVRGFIIPLYVGLTP